MAPVVSGVFRHSYMTPQEIGMALYFPDTVCYELTVFSIVAMPVKENCTIQPTLNVGRQRVPF